MHDSPHDSCDRGPGKMKWRLSFFFVFWSSVAALIHRPLVEAFNISPTASAQHPECISHRAGGECLKQYEKNKRETKEAEVFVLTAVRSTCSEDNMDKRLYSLLMKLITYWGDMIKEKKLTMPSIICWTYTRCAKVYNHKSIALEGLLHICQGLLFIKMHFSKN